MTNCSKIFIFECIFLSVCLCFMLEQASAAIVIAPSTIFIGAYCELCILLGLIGKQSVSDTLLALKALTI